MFPYGGRAGERNISDIGVMVNDIPHHGVINPATPTDVTTCARPAGSINSKLASVSIACLMVCAGHAAIHCAALAGLGLTFIPEVYPARSGLRQARQRDG
jgi:hypothetical protein